MKFNIQQWRNFYDISHGLGRILNNKELKLDKKLKEDLFNAINISLKNSRKYLDSKYIFMPRPKWEYKIEDPRTHASHKDFAFNHLI
jgi:hypothetical protein